VAGAGRVCGLWVVVGWAPPPPARPPLGPGMQDARCEPDLPAPRPAITCDMGVYIWPCPCPGNRAALVHSNTAMGSWAQTQQAATSTSGGCCEARDTRMLPPPPPLRTTGWVAAAACMAGAPHGQATAWPSRTPRLAETRVPCVLRPAQSQTGAGPCHKKQLAGKKVCR
jgi:hypothetical protein